MPLAVITAIVIIKFWATRSLVLDDANVLRALALEGGFALLLLSLTGTLLARYRVWAWLIVDLLFSVLCVITIMYVAQYEDVPTLAALGVARELGGVEDAVVDMLNWSFLLYFVDVVLLALLFAWPLRKRRIVSRAFDGRLVALVGVAAVWVAVTAFSVATAGPIASGIAGASKWGMVSYGLFSRPSQSDGGVGADLGDEGPVSGGADATATAAAVGKLDLSDPAAVQARFDQLQGYTGSKRVAGAPAPASAKKRNVIIIQVEALAAWTVGANVGGRPVAPNLKSLSQESWFTPRMMTQIGRGNTSDAEFAANTSLLTEKSDPSSYLWGGKVLPGLPRLARAAGYQAFTFHPNDLSFWRRDLLYPALGFTRAYSRPDFPTNDRLGIGASDAVLFATVMKTLDAKRAAGQPFVAEVITLSSHSPYNAGSSRGDLELTPDLSGTRTGRYLRAIHYADERIGAFVEALKANGMWEDTVLVVYGDHFGVRPWGTSPIPLSDAEKRAFPGVIGRPGSVEDIYSVPFIVHVPGQSAGRRLDGVFGQVDVMPTVADLVGFDLAKTPHVGASAFEDRDRAIAIRYYAPEGSFITNDYLFKPGIGYSDGRVLKLSDSSDAPLSLAPESVYRDIYALSALNRAYLKSLPAR